VISNRNWVTWTGLKDRAKEYAIAGLREKGLEVDGRGDNATYSFSSKQFGAFLTTAKPPEVEKPRTKGRAVVANPGQKIHEDCAANGCAKLCEDCSGPGSNAQPVARIAIVGPGSNAQPVARTAILGSGSNAQPVARTGKSNAQPVARTGKPESRRPGKSNAQPVARSYPLTLAALKHFYATADIVFVAKLVQTVEREIGVTPSDERLATCILPKKGQHSEGLFLYTVPLVYQKTWHAEDPAWVDSAVEPSKVASFAGLIKRLEVFADQDGRFARLVQDAVPKLKAMEKRPIDDALVVKLTLIENPFELLALDLCRGSVEFNSYSEDAKSVCDSMKLKDEDRQKHLRFLLSSKAFEILRVPAFHF